MKTFLRSYRLPFAILLPPALILAATALPGTPLAGTSDRPPNIILIVADDMGYADLSCQGATGFATPHLDRLAAEGTRFTSFYVAQAVCTASRAAFLSGSLPNRISLQGALNHTSRNGIHPDEWLLPEMFKERGYATAGFGKWHLSTVLEFGPMRNGFDEWLGIPYSNDNSRYHPVLGDVMPPLPLYDSERVIELDPDQGQFTRRFTERAVSFIERHATKPFFLYLPHVMPHVPIFASADFKGRTPRGTYGDVIEELDASVGELMKTLRRFGLDENTLVIFFSDNGPWLSYGEHAGSATPLREGKLTAFEGGVRVPCIMRWPGRVPASRVCDEPVMSIDLLPTLTAVVNGKPSSLPIDGLSIEPLVFGVPGAKSPHEALFFYTGSELHAIRSGNWKLHFPHSYITTAGEPGKGGKPSEWGKHQSKSIVQSGIEGIASRHGGRVTQIGLSLFDLETDPEESRNLATELPEIVAKLARLAAPIRAELGDTITKTTGTAQRPAGVVP